MIDRRTFLSTTSALAITACAGGDAGVASYRGEPFSDGTFFDDGSGWVD